MQATCASPEGPRHAHPRWIGGGAPSQHIVHVGDVSASAPNPAFFVALLFARRVEVWAPIFAVFSPLLKYIFFLFFVFCFLFFFCLVAFCFVYPLAKKAKETKKSGVRDFLVPFYFLYFSFTSTDTLGAYALE
jgi:hypothetical protein